MQSSKRPSKIKDDDFQDAMDKAHNAIIISFGDGVLIDGRSDYSCWSLEEIGGFLHEEVFY